MSPAKLLNVFKNTPLRFVYPYGSLIPSPSSLADPNRTAVTSPAATRGQHRRTGVGASPYSPPLPPFVDKTPQNCCHRFCCHQGTVHKGGIGAPSPKDSVPPSESSLGVDGLPSPPVLSLTPYTPTPLTGCMKMLVPSRNSSLEFIPVSGFRWTILTHSLAFLLCGFSKN